MKKIIGVAAFAVLGMIALSSCKKDYTCVCTYPIGSTTSVYKDVKKKTAEDACTVENIDAATLSGSCSLLN